MGRVDDEVRGQTQNSPGARVRFDSAGTIVLKRLEVETKQNKNKFFRQEDGDDAAGGRGLFKSEILTRHGPPATAHPDRGAGAAS